MSTCVETNDKPVDLKCHCFLETNDPPGSYFFRRGSSTGIQQEVEGEEKEKFARLIIHS